MTYKVINVQDIDKYPDNYDFLEPEQKMKIIGYMNGIQKLADRYNAKYITELEFSVDNNDVPNDINRYLRLYNHTITSLTGSKNAYATLGIMCEYDWPHHANEWILATKQDAIDYNNFQETEVDEEVNNILDNTLLDYSDVGI